LSNLSYVLLGVAAIPAIYWLLAIYSALRFFSQAWEKQARAPEFTPAVSCLKPIRGLDPEAYENYASFCRQDYPEYEIVFCVDEDDPAVPILNRLIQDFPERSIRLLFGSDPKAVNDKVARLDRLTRAARHDLFVITDGDVRVRPDYLRNVVAPFRDPKVGSATCLYASTRETSFIEELQSMGMLSDFFVGIVVAWQVDGVKFALSQTIVTTRKNVEGFGGYLAIVDRPADDLWIGRLATEQGFESVLLPYVVHTVADFHSFRELFVKRTRWMTVMRHMRPWGHFGLIFTWFLPWSLLAFAVHPTGAIAAAYFGTYLLLRTVATLLVAQWGMKQESVWKKLFLIPVWDALAFAIWLTSFWQKTIQWRGEDYSLENGTLVLATARGKQVAAS
jgi:ceramide glucosyltransferase